ncbi:MAG: hypothetical protein HGA27_02695 [Peptococcaceae bacterium]|nr:hypothetical protein [Peptococcaceae bacterium]
MDKLTYDVLTGTFNSIGKSCQDYLIENAFSPAVKYNRDFSSALYSSEGKIVFLDKNKSLHPGILPPSINKILEAFPLETLKKGDCIITNDPQITGQPLIYLVAVAPIFFYGRALFLAVSVMSYSEIGGSIYSNISENILDEGIIITPVRIFKEGLLSKGFYSIIIDNVRMKEEFYWDLRSQYIALQLAAGKINKLLDKYGLTKIKGFLSESVERTKTITEVILRGIASRSTLSIHNREASATQSIKVYFCNCNNKFVVDFSNSLFLEGLRPISPLAAQACFFEAIQEILPKDIGFNSGIIDLIYFIFCENAIQKAKLPKSLSVGYSITKPLITDHLKSLLKATSYTVMGQYRSSVVGILFLTGYSKNSNKYYSISIKLTDRVDQSIYNHSVEIFEQNFPPLLGKIEFSGEKNKVIERTFNAIENKVSMALAASDQYSIVLLKNNPSEDIIILLKEDNNPVSDNNNRVYLAEIPQGKSLIIRTELS